MKRIISMIVILAACISFVGCAESEESLSNNIAELKAEVSALEDEISQLEKEKA